MLKLRPYGFLLILGILPTGCKGTGSYIGTDEDYYETSVSQKVQVYIRERNQDSFKSSGAIDEDEDFRGKTLYIYSFHEGDSFDADEGQISVTGAPACLLDGAVAELGDVFAPATWKYGLQPEYPKKEFSKDAYLFFGCYIDDLEKEDVRVQKSQDRVIFDLQLNGMQDIMSGKAEGTYNYVAAQKDDHPVLKLKHRLVKLHFRVKPGITPGLQKWIRVDNLELKSCMQMRLPVAARLEEDFVPEFYGEQESIFLCSVATGTPVSSEMDVCVKTVDNPDESPEVIEQMTVDIADAKDCFLLPPAASYPYTLTLSESKAGEDGEPVGYGMPASTNGKILQLAEGKMFEAGRAYVITFRVFGRNEVAVFVEELESWETYPYEGELEFTDDIPE